MSRRGHPGEERVSDLMTVIHRARVIPSLSRDLRRGEVARFLDYARNDSAVRRVFATRLSTNALAVLALLGLMVAGTVGAQPVSVVGTIRTGSPHEAAFWQVWTAQDAAPSDHAAHLDAWRAFADAARSGDPLIPVAHTLAAWHALRAGREAEAIRLLEPYVNTQSTVETMRGARELARAWLTGLDREQVVRALEAYRVHAVRYPETLDALATQPGADPRARPPLHDCWGTPWDYRLARLRSMPTLEGQRYTLASRTLGELSVLRTALALKPGEQIALRPVQVRAMADRPPLVTLAHEGPAGGTVAIQAGATRDGVTLAYVSPVLVILRDRLHWRAFNIR